MDASQFEQETQSDSDSESQSDSDSESQSDSASDSDSDSDAASASDSGSDSDSDSDSASDSDSDSGSDSGSDSDSGSNTESSATAIPSATPEAPRARQSAFSPSSSAASGDAALAPGTGRSHHNSRVAAAARQKREPGGLRGAEPPGNHEEREPGGRWGAEPAEPPRNHAVFFFGAIGALAALSLLASIPVLQFATLGWLLEAEGRVARTGRLRGSLPGLRRLARFGSALVVAGLLALPVLVLHSYHRDAELLDPTSSVARGLRQGCWGATALALGYGALILAAGGGRLRQLFRPFASARWLVERLLAGASLRDALGAVAGGLRALRLPHYLALGVQGFVVGVAWLALPTTLLVAGTRGAPGLGLLGALLLVVVFPWLLVAQGRLARTGEVREAFRLGELRRTIRRAPLASAAALVLTLGPALPLYVWKVEALPRDALWLPALFFVTALLPGRLLAGWAVARGAREGRAHWALRLLGWSVRVPAGAAYVFLLFFTQYFDWRGGLGLYAQHAFLLPVAFY